MEVEMKKLLALVVLSLLISQGHAMDKFYTPAKILLKGITPKKEIVSHILPKKFFIEERDGVVVEKIRENLLYVHDKRKKEKEFFLENGERAREFGLHHKQHGGKDLDRRLKVQNVLDIQYRPICLLRGIYKINDEDDIIYSASGFRNTLNQVITAGHSLHLSSEDIGSFCASKKISLKSYNFDPNLLTVELIFGFRSSGENFYYNYVSSVNGKNCFVNEDKDIGVVNLPTHKREEMDNILGGFPIANIPDQPHEYLERDITIVGYPGEKNPKSLWYHSGPIKQMYPNKITMYDVDTTAGNSGSPGFIDFFLKKELTDINDLPVCLIHTSSDASLKLNIGQGFDEDSVEFIESIRKP